MRMPEMARLITCCWICSVPSKVFRQFLLQLHGCDLLLSIGDPGARFPPGPAGEVKGVG